MRKTILYSARAAPCFGLVPLCLAAGRQDPTEYASHNLEGFRVGVLGLFYEDNVSIPRASIAHLHGTSIDVYFLRTHFVMILHTGAVKRSVVTVPQKKKKMIFPYLHRGVTMACSAGSE